MANNIILKIINVLCLLSLLLLLLLLLFRNQCQILSFKNTSATLAASLVKTERLTYHAYDFINSGELIERSNKSFEPVQLSNSL